MKSRKRKQTQPRFNPPASMTRRQFNGHNVGWFWDDCYREAFHLIWPVNAQQFNHYINHMFGRDRTDDYDGWAGYHMSVDTPNGSRQVIALRNKWDGSSEAIGYLTHECFHAAHDVLISRGEKLSIEHSEPYAYLLQSIVDRCLQIITNKPV